MKITITILLSLILGVGYSQSNGNFKQLKADDASVSKYLRVPIDTTLAPKYFGEIRYNQSDSSFYGAKHTTGFGQIWFKVGGGTSSYTDAAIKDLAAEVIHDSLTNLPETYLDAAYPIKKTIISGPAGDTVRFSIDTAYHSESGDASLTLTGITNMASVSTASGTYTRVGDVVETTILIGFDPTAGSATFSEIDCTLPIAVQIPANNRVNGNYTSLVDYGMVGISPANNQKVRITFNSNTVAPNQAIVKFSYKIK